MLTCALFAILSIGILSRSIWYDEAITVQSLANQPFSLPDAGFLDLAQFQQFVQGPGTFRQVLQHYIGADVHPPLYFTVAHIGTLLFGLDVVVVRYVSLVLVLASVVIYGQALRRHNQDKWWLVVLVYGLSFAAATTAQDARGYAMALFLGVAAWHLLASMEFDRETSIPLWKDVLLGLSCGGLLLTHYFALFVVVPLLAWRFFGGLYNRDVRCLVAPIVAFVVFLPWLPIALEHLGARPDQMTGFQGLVTWIKRAVQMTSGQVLSATHFFVPGSVQTLGRLGVVLLMLIGAVSALWPGQTNRSRRAFGQIAVWVPAVGLGCFLVASIAMDRWFDTLRYYIFFAPFFAYLAASGALVIGDAIARYTSTALAYAPIALLLLAQVGMLNFGWETNRNRGGGYYNSLSAQVQAAGPLNSLAIVDTKTGRGTILSAIYTLPPETRTYLLSSDTEGWTADAEVIEPVLSEVGTVILAFTIDRGRMDSDKASLYGPIVEILERNGFTRVAAPPVPQGQRFYAKWEK